MTEVTSVAVTSRIYTGLIREADHGEAMDILFLGDSDEPFAETIRDDRDTCGPYATVRYFVSDEPKSRNELEESLIRRLSGAVDADYTDQYSEITGYLWTDEDVTVGGHDLLEELRSHMGRYAYLEIEWRRTT